MRIAILGTGAMGSIYGARLSSANEVHIIGRNGELIEHVSRDGLILEEAGGEHIFHPQAHLSSDGLPEMDLVVLSVKSYATREVLEKNKSLIGEKTLLMVLQNGGGYEDILAEYAPCRVVIGTSEDNGNVLEMGKVRHGGNGRTNIGSLDGVALDGIKSAFDASGFDCIIHQDINRVIWHKLMINASLSVMTGLLGCETSFIASDEYAWYACSRLVEEIVRTAGAIGIPFSLSEETERVRRTSLSQPGSFTSIAMDIRNGRKTEVDAISGYVRRTAIANGIAVPYTDMAVSMIHALERR